MNDKKTLVYLAIQNYSKTSIKGMKVRQVIFESKIRDGIESICSDIGEKWFALMPEKQRFSVAPAGTEHIVINLNRLLPKLKGPTNEVGIALFQDHVFILAFLEYGIPFLPRTVKEKAVLYYDRENADWFVASSHHNEMKVLFHDIFRFLENNNMAGLVDYMEEKQSKNKS